MRKVKHTEAMRDYHRTVLMTEKQRVRIAKGKTESTPEDYGHVISDDQRRMREARHAVEDRRMERELGLDPGSL
ncbi:MAG: hypothetical protein KA761_00070 [Gemmatimonadaceae bacterium]|nr:hypothetical protein [Gemmatimonadaceae bacterium]